jgi:hypothetical protein
VPLQPISQRRLDQVLGCAPERDEKVVIIRVDGGTTARKVRQYRNRVVVKVELPALRVMARWRQGRVTHEFMQKSGFVAGRKLAVTPSAIRNSFVTVYTRLRRARRQTCHCADSGERRKGKFSSRRHGQNSSSVSLNAAIQQERGLSARSAAMACYPMSLSYSP